MGTSIKWNIVNLERTLPEEIVFTVHYTVGATCEDEYYASSYGSIGLEKPEDNIIPFEDLTEELVISWLKDKLGEEQVASIENALENAINEQKTPKSSSGLPW